MVTSEVHYAGTFINTMKSLQYQSKQMKAQILRWDNISTPKEPKKLGYILCLHNEPKELNAR